MTSSAGGDGGTSYGFIKYDQVEMGFSHPQINVFGGEDRLWFGPEGGQFSVFFEGGEAFDFANWNVPPVMDTVAFNIVDQTETQVKFHYDATLTNFSGTTFTISIQRDVALLSTHDAAVALKTSLDGLSVVAYESRNRITNTGEADWTKEDGLLSIWVLAMYKHGPQTTIVIPYLTGDNDTLGPVVIDDYFGEVAAERLVVGDNAIFFSGDGQERGKIGLTPQRATPVCGSWDAGRGVLTIVQYNQPDAEVTDYVNSMWELQDDPFSGDVINSYNDGPPEPGAAPLGPFYELETSSPALALAAGHAGVHIHRTIHLEGDRAALDRVAQHVLGATLDEIEEAIVR